MQIRCCKKGIFYKGIFILTHFIVNPLREIYLLPLLSFRQSQHYFNIFKEKIIINDIWLSIVLYLACGILIRDNLIRGHLTVPTYSFGVWYLLKSEPYNSIMTLNLTV